MKYLEGLDGVIEDAMKRMNVPGAAVAIVDGGKIVYEKAFGASDIKAKKALEPSSLLPIGSSSKAFTATSVVMLAADGALDLDAPIRNYIPEFVLYDDFASKEATPRDLLCHRTGLPRHEPMWMDWSTLSRDDLVLNRVKNFKPNKPFRSAWEYQNHMFAVLGYLVERVSGKTWEEFVEKRIFKPLGITQYSFCHPESDPKGLYAKLYTPDDNDRNKENEPLRFAAMGPAGAIILTAEGFGKWVAFNLAGGKVGRRQLVDPAVFAELHKPNISYELLPFSFDERFPVGYGLGWFIDSFRGLKLVEHGGNVNGGTALASFLPDKGFGCAILTNADSSMMPDALSSAIYDRYLGIEGGIDWIGAYDSNMKAYIAEMKVQLEGLLPKKIEGKPCSHEFKEYAGDYAEAAYGDAAIQATRNGLKLRYHDKVHTLTHLHYDTFAFEFIKDMHMTLTFRTSPSGEVEAFEIPFELSLPGDPIRFVRKAADESKA